MIIFIARRIVWGVLVLFVVSSLAFFLLYFSSSGVARATLGDQATQAQVHAKEVQLGLTQPLPVRYIDWLGQALHGQFGTSWFTSQSVTTSMLTRLPSTLSLVLVTIVITAILATFLGVSAAVRRGKLDAFLQVLSIAGAAIPQFVLALLIVTIFAIRLHWFPATGYVPLTSSVGGWAGSLVLPVVALVVGAIAATAQQVRSAVIKELDKDYVRTLRSRGLPEREIIYRHVLRGAAPAGMLVLSLRFIGMLGGVVVIEQIFALPGIGFLALQSTLRGDMPVLMGVVVYVVAIVVIVNLLTDLAVGWVNPKARVA